MTSHAIAGNSGYPTISIALGCISEIGYLRERPDVERMMLRKGVARGQRSGRFITGLEVEVMVHLDKSEGFHGSIFDNVRLVS